MFLLLSLDYVSTPPDGAQTSVSESSFRPCLVTHSLSLSPSRFSLDESSSSVGDGSGVNSALDFVEEKMFCHHCDDSLAGHRYVLREDHPYCIKCYENVFANNCDECNKIIGIDSKAS